MKRFWMGLDIGGTKCAVLLARVNHGIEIADKIRFDTCADRGLVFTYDRLCAGMEEILSRQHTDWTQVEAVGISCGGPLDARRGVVLCPPHLPGWVNVPIADMLQKKYGVPVYLQNDANACALVEWKLGAGQGADNMIFLTMGTGMGGGVIAEGRLLQGASDMGGEIGHLRLTDDGPVGFGKAGSVEGYVSGAAMASRGRAMTEKLTAEGKTPAWVRDGHALADVDARLLAEYARKGDQDALRFYAETGDYLGRTLAMLADAFNPERIVIGSIFVRCEDLLRPAMERALIREALPQAVQALRVEPAKTGEEIGDLASIMTALYARGIDPMAVGDERDERVLRWYDRLFARYPALEPCRDSVMQAYLMIRDCYAGGGKVLVCGNGGSCADSEHIVGELMKGFWLKRPMPDEKQAALAREMDGILPGAAAKMQQGLPAIALTGHAALSTAVQNDQDPTLALAQQAVGYGRPGDVIIGISTSGNAKNVALALAAAKALGLGTVGLTGGEGGRMKEMCDCVIAAPARTPADVQEYHLPIYHTLCAMAEAKFFQE